MKILSIFFVIFLQALCGNCFCMQWNEVKLSNVKLDIQFDSNRFNCIDSLLIPIKSMVSEKPKISFFFNKIGNTIFAKASLFSEKIIIYDCIGSAPTFNKMSKIEQQIKDGFIGKILGTLKKIDKNLIGRRLLIDIMHARSPVIILPHDFLSKIGVVAASVPSDDLIALDTALATGIRPISGPTPDVIRQSIITAIIKNGAIDIFPLETKDIIFGGGDLQFILGKFIYLSSNSQFCPSSIKNLKANIVFFRFSEKLHNEQFGFFLEPPNKIDYPNLHIESGGALVRRLPTYEDAALFHELNHYRHFLMGKNTIGANVSPKVNAYNNCSSLEILPGRANIFTAPEEELQLTGITTLDRKDNYITDYINETHYRLVAGYPIRFPYFVTDANLPVDSRYLQKKEVELLLKTAVNPTEFEMKKRYNNKEMTSFF